jgi:nucleoside-diphosphate-sugar epimerase
VTERYKQDSPEGHILSLTDRILITGANGFIGAKVVENLLERGYSNLRCFLRPACERKRLDEVLKANTVTNGVEIVSGDLLSRDDCRRATENITAIYHLAAGIEKSFAGAFMNSGLGTRNLMDAFLEVGKGKRFVNVSSFAVYSNLNLKRGAVLDESCPLESDSQARFDAYGFGKLKQDELVSEYGTKRGLRYVTVRPGSVYGPGRSALSGRIGVDTFGVFLHLGGSNVLPLVYVDNCADAIVSAGLVPGIEGEVFNVVDDELLTSRQFLRAVKKQTGMPFSIPMPYFVTYALCVLWEKYSHWSRGQLPPVFNRRRCAAEWKDQKFSNAKLRQRLGWKPRVPLSNAMRSFLGQYS